MRKVTCRNGGCKHSVAFSQLNDHLQVCEYRKIVCQACRHEVVFINKQDHDNN